MESRTFNIDKLLKLLIKHEGLQLKAYRCSQGKLTIGVGRNIEDLGITQGEALVLLVNDIDRIQSEAKDLIASYELLDDVRKTVVLSMIFNLGATRFSKFKNLINFVNEGNFIQAAAEMQTSLWYYQVGQRAEDLYQMMLTGQYIDAVM